MASELQDTLDRIMAKSRVLIEKYTLLEQKNQQLAEQIVLLQSQVEQLHKQNEQLQQQNHYLSIARSIVPDSKQLANSKAIISSLVQKVDQCIAHLEQ